MKRFTSHPDQALQEAIGHIMALQTIYRKENDVLSRADTNGFLALQNEKLEAAQLYQSSIKGLLTRKDEIKTASASLKNKLQVMQKDFSALTAENLVLVQRMRRCTDRLGETLMNAAREAVRRQRPLNYTADGRFEDNENKSVSTGINETA